MGRIKTRQTKRIAQDLYEQNQGKFSPDFKQNKDAIKGLATFESSRMRNVVAGYVTRISARSKKP